MSNEKATDKYKRYREKHKEQIAAYMKNYREKNREKLAAVEKVSHAAYYEEHAEEIKAKMRASKGGPHTRDNVQAAHLDCNRRKGARVA